MKVLFFASTSDITKCEIAEFQIDTTKLKDFHALLSERWPGLKNITFVLAVNKVVISDDSYLLKNNDEVALLPPFSGG